MAKVITVHKVDVTPAMAVRRTHDFDSFPGVRTMNVGALHYARAVQFAVVTQNIVFTFKGTPNEDTFVVSLVFKMVLLCDATRAMSFQLIGLCWALACGPGIYLDTAEL